MKLRLLGAFVLGAAAFVSVAPRASFAQDPPAPDAKPDRQGMPRNAQFAEAITDPNDSGKPVEVRLKDGTSWRIATDLSDARWKKIRILALTLHSNDDVIVWIDKGELVDMQKGRLKKEIEQLPDELRKKIDDTQEGDEVIIQAARIWEAMVFKKTDMGLYIHPKITNAPANPAGGVAGKYDKGEMVIAYHDISGFTNKTAEQRAQLDKLNAKKEPIKDAVDRLQLKPLDTVRVGLVVTGRVEEVTADALKVKAWNMIDGTWGEVKEFKRGAGGELPPIEVVPLKHKRSYPIQTANGPSEVILEEERIHQSSSTPPLRLKGSIWHDQKDYVLAGAILEFQGGAKDANWSQSPLREDLQVEPVFCGDRVVEERMLGIDAEDGEVKLDFNPAKHMVPATSSLAKTYALRALATKTDQAQLACVWAFVSRTNDPDFALMLAYQYGQVPNTADSERTKTALLEALQSFGDVGTQTIVEHIVVPDGVYRIPEAQAQGTINWRSMSDSAGNLKKKELELLDKLPGASKGERGKKLFDLYEERGTEFAEPVMKIFTARTDEAIDALLEIAISTSAQSNPTSDAIKRAEHAVDLIKRLGDKALSSLCDRIERQGKQGLIEARKLRQMVTGANPTPVPDVIQIALERLIEWKRQEFRAALDRSLDDARTLANEKKWSEALAKVEEIIHLDRDHQEAKKMLYQCLMRVAEQLYAQKRRGDASIRLRRILDDKWKGTGAEALMGRIVLEVAREDAAAVCIRSGPLETYEVIRNATPNEVLPIANVKTPIENWLPVRLAKDNSPPGWVFAANATPTNGGAACQIARPSATPEQVRKLLAQVRELAPELKPQADQIDGDFWLRDAEEKYSNGKYDSALVSYDQASRLCPDDPRLVNRKWCQLRVNAMLLAIFGGGVVVLAILGAVLSLRRQKRVHITEFKYYGKDRARAEREIDGNAPGGDAGGATAEPAPASEAPKT